MARKADVGVALEEAIPPAAPVNGGVTLPELPTVKTGSAASLEEKTILIHGPAGIGKSTLASQFPDYLFLDCSGELSGLDVYRMPVLNWDDFRLACASLVKDKKQFKGVVIDTAGTLATYCRQAVYTKLGIEHESDAEWGKGWDKVKSEFSPRAAALSAMEGLGVIWIAHSVSKEIKTRSASYDRWMPALPGAIREPLVTGADLVLFLDWNQQEERVIYTKPSAYHEAKERAESPRLPEEIQWPLGTNGYDILRKEWGS